MAESDVTNAFLLGWAVAETVGHLRRGTRPSRRPSPPQALAPRLVVSDGEVKKETDAFLLAAERVAQCYRAYEFESDDHLSPLTQEVYALPGKIRAWLNDPRAPFYSPRALRELLDAWSLQTWARLNAA